MVGTKSIVKLIIEGSKKSLLEYLDICKKENKEPSIEGYLHFLNKVLEELKRKKVK